MPSSRATTIPIVTHLIKQLQPESILDVGVGFGKWGHLFREYTDILASESDPARYKRENWKVRIDGIEGFPQYLTPMHEFLYDRIHVGDMCELIRSLGEYDVIYLGDVIEHIEKDAGRRFLEDCQSRARKAVIISTPKFETGQEDLCDNELEKHRSLWSESDFEAFAGGLAAVADGGTIVAVLAKEGCRDLVCASEWYGDRQFNANHRPMPPFKRWCRWGLVRLIGWRRFQEWESKRQATRASR